MVTRDVDLVIRAKDQTQNTFRSINDALDRFNASQKTTQEQSGQTDSALDRFGAALAQLRSSLGGDLGARINQQFAQARAEISRLETSTREVSGELLRYTAAAKEAGRTTESLGARQARLQSARNQEIQSLTRQGVKIQEARRATQGLGNQVKDLDVRIRASQNSFTNLNKSIDSTRAALQKQGDQLARAQQGYRNLRQESAGLGAALERVGVAARRSFLEAFGQQRGRLAQVREEFQSISRTASMLGAELKRTAQPTRELQEAFEKARAAAARGRQEYRQQAVILEQIRRVLRESGGDLTVFADRQQRISAALERGAQSQREFATQSARAASTASTLSTTQERQAGATERQARASRQAAAATRAHANENRNLRQVIERVYGETRRALSFTQRLRGQVLSLIGTYVSFFGAIRGFQEVIRTYQTIETATNRLNAALQGDTQAVGNTLEFLRRQAQRLGIQFGILSNEYSKFAIATQGTNLQGEATRRIFLRVAEAARVNNLSQEHLRGTFVALTQIVSKGVVSMEEIRQQLGDRIPGAIQILADALDITTGELIKMIEQGRLSSDVLLQFADELNDRFGRSLPASLESLNAQIGRFANAAFEAFRAFGQGGAIAGIQNLFASLAETFRSAQFLSFLERAAVLFGGLSSAIGFVAANFQVLIPLIAAFVGYKLAPLLGAFVIGFDKLRGSLRRVRTGLIAVNGQIAATGRLARAGAVAVGAFTGAFRLLLSSTGIGLAVAAISAGLGVWITRTKDATAALIEHRKILDQVKLAYDQTGDNVEKFREAVAGSLTSTQVRAQLLALQSDISSVGAEFRGLFADLIGPRGIRMFAEETTSQFRILANAFLSGVIGLGEFNQESDILARQDPSIAPLIEQAQELAKRFDELTQRGKELRLILSTLEDPDDLAQDSLNQLGDNGGAAPENEAERLRKLNAELVRLQKLAPGAAQELKDAEIDKVFEEAAERARELARGGDEVRVVLDAISRARGAIRLERLFRGTSGLAAVSRLLRQITGLSGDELVDRTLNLRDQLSDLFGATQFDVFTDRQQAVLVALTEVLDGMPASLQNAVEEAVRTGSTEGLADAIGEFGLELSSAGQGDLIGTSLAAFDTEGLDISGLLNNEIRAREELARARQEELKLLAEQRAATTERLEEAGFELDQQNLKNAGLEREAFIQERIREAIAENPNITEQTLALYRDQLNELLDQEEAYRRIQEQQRAAQAALEADQATESRIRGLGFQVDQQNLINAGKEREAAIEAELNAARRENANITQQQLEDIRNLAGARFDALNQDRERLEQEQRVNDLLALRQTIQQRLNDLAIGPGSGEIYQQLQTQLQGVNLELDQALDAFIEILENIENMTPAMRALLTEMKRLKTEAESTGQVFSITYNEVFQFVANEGANAILSWVEAIASGENAVKSFGEAFRQFAANTLQWLATMILRAIIFRALVSAFPGFGQLFLFHDGGVVGSGGTRLPSTRRGLRSNEVTAVLERGEEVLTADDPRHIRNIETGGRESMGVTVVNAVDSVSFLDEALKTRQGSEILLNRIQSDRAKYRSALGV